MSWQKAFEENIRELLKNPSDYLKNMDIKNTIRGMTRIFYKEEDRIFMRSCLDKIAMENGMKGRNEILKLLER